MNNYEWLLQLKVNSWSIDVNEQAANYCTAKQWIEERTNPEDWAEVSPDDLQKMKDTNSIFRLQIYPHTPVGFNMWYGPTLDSVIEQARRDNA